MSPREIYFIFMFACLAAFVIGGVVAVVRRVRAGLPLRRPVVAGARYADAWVSGRSLRTRLSRFGGAKNCLWVTVTADEFWTGLHFPFNVLLPGADNLERRVRGADIIAVEDSTLLPVRTRVVVRFRRAADGAEDAIEIAVRDREAFRRSLAEIGAQLLMTPPPSPLTPGGPSPHAPSARVAPAPAPSVRPTPSRS